MGKWVKARMEVPIKELINSMHEQCHVLGSVDGYVRSARPIDQADDDSLCFCKEKSERALGMITSSKARVIVCSDSLKLPGRRTLGQDSYPGC